MSKKKSLTNLEIQTTIRGGQRCFSSQFISWSLKNNKEKNCFGFIVGKSKVKKAVERNKIRRIAREVFRLDSDLKLGLNIVIAVRKKQAHWNKKTLHIDLNRLLQELIKKERN